MNSKLAVKNALNWIMGRTGEVETLKEATLDQSRLWAEQQVLTKGWCAAAQSPCSACWPGLR